MVHLSCNNHLENLPRYVNNKIHMESGTADSADFCHISSWMWADQAPITCMDSNLIQCLSFYIFTEGHRYISYGICMLINFLKGLFSIFIHWKLLFNTAVLSCCLYPKACLKFITSYSILLYINYKLTLGLRTKKFDNEFGYTT